MQLRQIGKTAIGVTEIGFGCSAIGNRYRKVTDAEAEFGLGRCLGSRHPLFRRGAFLRPGLGRGATWGLPARPPAG